jgi:hypothetical protein
VINHMLSSATKLRNFDSYKLWVHSVRGAKTLAVQQHPFRSPHGTPAQTVEVALRRRSPLFSS